MRILPPKVENNLRVGAVFYCKDCEKIVGVTPVGRKFVYRCNICKTKNVAFGSDKSIKNYYHVKEEPGVTVGAVGAVASATGSANTVGVAVSATGSANTVGVAAQPVAVNSAETVNPSAQAQSVTAPKPVPEGR